MVKTGTPPYRSAAEGGGGRGRSREGALPERFPPSAARGRIYLVNHPEQPDGDTVLNPMHRIRELLGCHVERWPVEVSIGDATRSRPSSCAGLPTTPQPRPGLDIALPGESVIEAMETVASIRVEARGTHLRLVARFVTPAGARRAAKLTRNACPPVAGGAS